MNIFYDIAEVILREYNKLTKKTKTIDQVTFADARSSATYPIVQYRTKNSYTVVTDNDGQSANIFYDRILTSVLGLIVANQAGRTGFPLMKNAGLTIRSLVPSINRAYGLNLRPEDVVDGPFDPTTATSVTVVFTEGALYFNDQGTITFPIVGSYKLDNGVCIIKPTVYNYLPGIWDEGMVAGGQTGVKKSPIFQTSKTDYTPVAHILMQYQGALYASDNRLINTSGYIRNYLLASALRSVDGIPWCVRSTDDCDHNLYNGWIVYNGSSRRLKGKSIHQDISDMLVSFSADMVDDTYDRVMVISLGSATKQYTAWAVIHYNIGQ